MPSQEEKFRRFLRRNLGDGLVNSLVCLFSNLHQAPSHVCECGKPVVFTMGSRTFKCTRCGKKWRLDMKVVEVKPRRKSK